MNNLSIEELIVLIKIRADKLNKITSEDKVNYPNYYNKLNKLEEVFNELKSRVKNVK